MFNPSIRPIHRYSNSNWLSFRNCIRISWNYVRRKVPLTSRTEDLFISVQQRNREGSICHLVETISFLMYACARVCVSMSIIFLQIKNLHLFSAFYRIDLKVSIVISFDAQIHFDDLGQKRREKNQ